MTQKKLFFPLDFSPHVVKSLETCVALNRKLGYQLFIFHAYSRPYDSSNPEVDLNRLEIDIDRQFEELSKQFDLASHSYTFKKKIGHSVDSILEEIESYDPDLIVMGTKGASGFGEILGTKTAKIIKSVDIPVLVLPSDTDLSGLDKIVLACDHSEKTSQEKLQFLVKMAEFYDAPIDIVTLNRDEKTMIKREIDNRNHLMDIMSHLKANVTFSHHENVERGLIEYCKEQGAGLVCVLPKSYNFIERAFHDSLTVHMAFHSPIPLLVLK